MSFKARSKVEKQILEKFVEKLEECDDVSPQVKEIIEGSLKETTISQSSEAKEIAEEIIKGKEDAPE